MIAICLIFALVSETQAQSARHVYRTEVTGLWAPDDFSCGIEGRVWAFSNTHVERGTVDYEIIILGGTKRAIRLELEEVQERRRRLITVTPPAGGRLLLSGGGEEASLIRCIPKAPVVVEAPDARAIYQARHLGEWIEEGGRCAIGADARKQWSFFDDIVVGGGEVRDILAVDPLEDPRIRLRFRLGPPLGLRPLSEGRAMLHVGAEDERILTRCPVRPPDLSGLPDGPRDTYDRVAPGTWRIDGTVCGDPGGWVFTPDTVTHADRTRPILAFDGTARDVEVLLPGEDGSGPLVLRLAFVGNVRAGAILGGEAFALVRCPD